MGTIHRTPLLNRTTKVTMVRSTARPTTILNPLMAVPPAEADLQTTGDIKLVVKQTADFPALVPAALQIAVDMAISIVHNGLHLDLMVVAAARLAPV